MITVELYHATSYCTEYVVKINGYIIGTILKQKDSVTESYPWQAFKSSQLLGSFFEKNGKKKAVTILINS